MKADDRVRKGDRPDWGLGRVLALLPNGGIRVVFEHVGEKHLRLDLAGLELVTGDESHSARLDHLRIDNDGRVIPGAFIADLIAKFEARYPGGFTGVDYLRLEREYKVAAHELAAGLLGPEALEPLLRAGAHEEICRRALQVLNKTNLVFRNEKMQLVDALKAATARDAFAPGLAALLHGKDLLEKRFTAWVDILAEIGVSKWPTATYHLYIQFPHEHFFLKPTVTQTAAKACGFELNYRPQLNWLTYRSALAFAALVRDEIEALGPRDMIDVQSFLWSVCG